MQTQKQKLQHFINLNKAIHRKSLYQLKIISYYVSSHSQRKDNIFKK